MTIYSKKIEMLKSYAAQKAQGFSDPKMEQLIASDDALKNIFRGILSSMEDSNGDVIDMENKLSARKEFVKTQLVNQFNSKRESTPNLIDQVLLYLIAVYQKAKLPPTYDMHILVGFNCSVILLILAFAMIVSGNDPNHFAFDPKEFPIGYKQ